METIIKILTNGTQTGAFFISISPASDEQPVLDELHQRLLLLNNTSTLTLTEANQYSGQYAGFYNNVSAYTTYSELINLLTPSAPLTNIIKLAIDSQPFRSFIRPIPIASQWP